MRQVAAYKRLKTKGTKSGRGRFNTGGGRLLKVVTVKL